MQRQDAPSIYDIIKHPRVQILPKVSVVGRTAFMVAAERALESEREELGELGVGPSVCSPKQSDAQKERIQTKDMNSSTKEWNRRTDWSVRSHLDSFGVFLKDALFVDPYAKALSGQDGLAMSDRLGEAACQFGFDNWPEFHKVLDGSCFFYFFYLQKFHGRCFNFADCQSLSGWPLLLN